MNRSALVTLCLLLSAPALHAQPASAGAPAFCPRAIAIVAQGGTPATVDSALQKVGYCGMNVWGQALGGGVARLRASTDSVAVDRMWRDTQWLRDGHIFGVALNIAGDNRASRISRMYAFRHLLQVGRPRYSADISELAQGLEMVGRRRRGCVVYRRGYDFPYEGAPLPAGAQQRIRDTAQRVFNEAGAPLPVRSAAQCILDTVAE